VARISRQHDPTSDDGKGRQGAARPIAALAVALAALTIAVYAPVRHFDFVQLDDPLYVSENPHVQGGLTPAAVAWAFTTGRAANWHPVTWISHMLDVQWFGVNPGRHHLTNLALHLANTLLLFALLARLTGAAWRSAVVAALFAVHPLHVESVAWIAERKDVLSTFFLLAATWAYWRYVRAAQARAAAGGEADRRTLRPAAWYGLLVALFALGLMAKPMLVTLPFVLLLLDVWPLGRLSLEPSSPPPRSGGGKRPRGKGPAPTSLAPGFLMAVWPLVREKIPLFALAAVSAVVTMAAQQRGGAVTGLDADPLGLRIENALVSAALYLRDTVWPAGLSSFYPFPSRVPAAQVLGALALLAAMSWPAWRARRTRPYLLVGWLWYLGMLVPVSGIVRVGLQARADRYTYVPLVGIFIMASWGVAEAAGRSRRLRAAAAVATAVAVLGFAWAARAQALWWRDNVALFTRAAMVSQHVDEYDAHMSLGAALGGQGRLDEARDHFAAAVRLRPRADAAHLALAIALGRQGRRQEAARELDEALRLNPGNQEAARLRAALDR
jgi:tetratricopeptide (TPR) repeat protein